MIPALSSLLRNIFEPNRFGFNGCQGQMAQFSCSRAAFVKKTFTKHKSNRAIMVY
jgi:hypothetical protein